MTKEQLTALTVKELKEIAKENGLKGYSKLRKAELIEAITKHEEAKATMATEKESFIELLEESNNIVYTEITHVSTSGMMRAVKIYIKNKNGTQDITDETQKYIGDSFHSSGGLKVAGAGFSAGFDIVYRLSLKLFGDKDRSGYKLTQRNL